MFNFIFNKPKRTFLSSSEFVSLGHPDRLSDLIASMVIDDIQHKDGWSSHAAIEVFLTHDTVVFSGEATTTLSIDIPYLRKTLTRAFRRAGYFSEMRKFWSKKEVCLPSNLFVVNNIQAQSVDIALGTTDKKQESGYNDQGIAMSSAENTNKFMLGVPHLLSMEISKQLSYISRTTILNDSTRKDLKVVLGPDNKVVVTLEVKEDGFTPICVKGVTIAVSHDATSEIESVRKVAKDAAIRVFNQNNIQISEDCIWTINGTGRFVIHGNISDTSMTGRKLSVSNPSAGPLWSNKLIGGGALVKPFHASDFLLNVASRLVSNTIVSLGLSSYAVTLVSCSIGSVKPQSVQIIGDSKFMKKYYEKCQEFFTNQFDWSVFGLTQQFGIFESKFDFSECVAENFFGSAYTHPWDNEKLISIWKNKLKNFL